MTFLLKGPHVVGVVRYYRTLDFRCSLGGGGGTEGGSAGSFPEQRLVIEPSITVSLVRARPHYNPFENTYIPMYIS